MTIRGGNLLIYDTYMYTDISIYLCLNIGSFSVQSLGTTFYLEKRDE